MSLKKELQARAGDLPEATIRKSRFSSAVAFWRGKKEFAYLMKNEAVEIRLTAKLIRALKPDYRLERNRKDWIVVHLEEEQDVDFAMQLLELAYKAHK